MTSRAGHWVLFSKHTCSFARDFSWGTVRFGSIFFVRDCAVLNEMGRMPTVMVNTVSLTGLCFWAGLTEGKRDCEEHDAVALWLRWDERGGGRRPA